MRSSPTSTSATRGVGNLSGRPDAYPADRSPIPGDAGDYFGTSPHNRARQPVHPSSTSGATEGHPAFAEFAPRPETFRLVLLTILIVHSEDRSAAVLCTSHLRTRLSPIGNLVQDCLATNTAASIPERKKAPGVSPRPSFAITSSLTAARETAPREVALDNSAEANASFFSLQASWRPSSVWPWLSWPRLFSPELFWRPLVRA